MKNDLTLQNLKPLSKPDQLLDRLISNYKPQHNVALQGLPNYCDYHGKFDSSCPVCPICDAHLYE